MPTGTVTVYTTSEDNNSTECVIHTQDQIDTENIVTSSPGNDNTSYDWTWLSINGKL